MMMDKRLRVLMKQRHFIKRIKRVFNTVDVIVTEDKKLVDINSLIWKDFMNSRAFNCYRTTSTPCSCYMCSGWKKYKRNNFKKETNRILKEELDFLS